MRGRYYEIRSMNGRYASYWNAFLFKIYFQHEKGVKKKELSNANDRSNSPAVSVAKSTGSSSPLRGILTSATEPVGIVPDLGATSSALLGLLTHPQPVRTLSPFPKPSLGTALEAARFVPSGQPRRAVPVQNNDQANHRPAANVNPALVSAMASSAAKDAIEKYGQNTVPAKPSSAVAQGKGKNCNKDKDFKSKAKPIADSVSTRPKRGKQRRNFSDLLQDDSEEESSEVREYN